jgi:hypothetical protein
MQNLTAATSKVIKQCERIEVKERSDFIAFSVLLSFSFLTRPSTLSPGGVFHMEVNKMIDSYIYIASNV